MPIAGVYASNSVSDCQDFLNDVNDALQRIGSRECIILLGDFNSHSETDSET